MNRIFSFLLFVFAVVTLPTMAQNAAVEQANVASAARYGRISRAAILAQLPELKMARTQLDSLRERKYDFIFDEDVKALPYLNPALCEDATAFVKEKLEVRR